METLTVEQRAANRKERNQAMKDFEQRFQDAVVKVADAVRSVEAPQFTRNTEIRLAVLKAAKKLLLLPDSAYDVINNSYKDLV